MLTDYPSGQTCVVGSLLGQDRFKIERVDDTCWIVAEETNDVADWFNNFDVGHEPIAGAIFTKTEKYCTKSGWFGICYSYGTREVSAQDRGADAFVKAFNDAHKTIEDLFNYECKGLTKFVYAGYSRGGALVQVAALSHMRKGMIKESDTVHMVTFGAPRALEFAQPLQGFLDSSHRVVNSGSILGLYTSYDPVPSMPAGSWGFQHVGETRYPSGLDQNGPAMGLHFDVSLHMPWNYGEWSVEHLF